MEETTIQLRQQNLDETDSMAQFESPDGDDICASYISRGVADELGEYAQVTVSDDARVTAIQTKTTANYAVYETAGGAVKGLYISHSIFGEDADAPESIGLVFDESSEDDFEESAGVDEEEVEGLLAGSDSDESDDDDENVEISDEELDLVEN